MFFVPFVAVLVGVAVAIPIAVIGVFAGDVVLDVLFNIFGFLFLVAYGWTETALTVKRLHDRDTSGWWMVGYFVPLLNLWVAIAVLFLGGTVGPNRFGPDPRGRVPQRMP